MQHPGQGRQRVGHGPALFDVGRDVEQAIAAHAVHLRVRPLQHPRPQLVPLRHGQFLRPARPGAVAEPRQALGSVAHHRVAQRLALPPDKAGRLRPARSLQGPRDRQGSQSRTPVRLALREPPQLSRAHVIPDHQAACSHQPLLRRTNRKAITFQPRHKSHKNQKLRQWVSDETGEAVDRLHRSKLEGQSC